MFDTFEADYDKLEQIAVRFADLSHVTQQMLQNIQQSTMALKNSDWKSEVSVSLFSTMYDEILPSTEKLQQAMNEASQVTIQIIRTVQLTEEETWDFMMHEVDGSNRVLLQQMKESLLQGVDQLQHVLKEVQLIVVNLDEGSLVGRGGTAFVHSIQNSLCPAVFQLIDKYKDMADNIDIQIQQL